MFTVTVYRASSGYLWEYSMALFWQFTLSMEILRRQGIDVIHACNPPDLISVGEREKIATECL
jgi:hypothetical protein